MIARNKLGVRAGYRMEFPLSAQNRRNFVRVPVSYRAKLHGRAFRPRMAGAAKRRSTEQRNTVTMRVAETADSTFEWRGIGAQVTIRTGITTLG